MQYSEALRRRAVEIASRRETVGFARGANRIIAARKLAGYKPLRLDEFAGASAAEPAFADFDDDAHRLHADDPDSGQFDDDPAQAAHSADDDAGYKTGHQAGYEAGLAQGFERGFAEANEQAASVQREAQAQAGASLASRIDSLSDALAQRFAELESEAADEIVALAIELAQQVLRSSLALRPEAIVDVVREALAALLDERSRVRVYLNPADADLVRIALGEQANALGREVVVDSAITPGGCRIETPRAEIDAQLETRWRRTLAAIGRNEDGSIVE